MAIFALAGLGDTGRPAPLTVDTVSVDPAASRALMAARVSPLAARLSLAPVTLRRPSSMNSFRVPPSPMYPDSRFPPPPVEATPPPSENTKLYVAIGLGLLVVGAVVYSQKDKMTANRRRGRKHRRSRRSRRGYGRRSRRR